MGSLPRESLQPFYDVSVMTTMTDLYAYKADDECRIDFQIHVTVTDHLTGSPNHQESYLYSDLHHYSRQSMPWPPPASPWRPSSPTFRSG